MSGTIEVTDYDQWEEMVEEWETVVEESPYDQSRWQTYYSMVVKSPEGKYYDLSWSCGSTEYQDLSWEDEYHSMVEVFPKEVTTTIYVTKEKLEN